MQSYYEQLRDPRWQKKRLQVMEAANFRCENCEDGSSELNIHHSSYLKGVPVWEHPDELLHCLCRACHKDRQEVEESLKIEMMKLLRKVPVARLKSVFFHVLSESLKESSL